ncbi:putative plastoquinol--plastocyanin reductase [Rosa chinensis]|uniref:Putative plastoquinol--plastocyanin reductase n=1 Tax=Rosa chinensis TaxID=74649 RepID=A0A2P6SBA1_ROSCH|nr:putative plastoquinol--plastocyanin reductase [Rosa chinensis]
MMGKGKGKGMRITCQAAIPADNVPDMGKRNLMNLLLLTNLTSLWFPMPLSLLHLGEFESLNNYSSGVGTGGQVTKDALGNDVIAAEWLKTHGPGDRTFTQGLKVLMHLTTISIYLESSSSFYNVVSPCGFQFWPWRGL